ncbi:MAG: PepSY domain-containing protein [Rhodothermales bacterium]
MQNESQKKPTIETVRKRGALLLVLAALILIPATVVYGQQLIDGADDCGPITGTIEVADDAPRATMMELARVTEAQARDAALAAISGMSADNVMDVDLDEEDGYLVYEVDLERDRVEHEVTVDAGSGEVLCTEQD